MFSYFQNFSFFRRLNKVPNINRGGCGYAALIIMDELGGSPLFMSNSKLVTEEILNGKAPSHVIVEIDGAYYDSKGKVSKKKFDKLWDLRDALIPATRKQLEDLLKNEKWNEDFNKEDLIQAGFSL